MIDDELINLTLLPYEIFILIDDNIVNGVKDDIYYISNYGRLYSKSSGKFLKSKIGSAGYPEYTLRHKNGKPLSTHIHRTIMKAFSPLDDYDNMVVNHKDGNKINNSLSNLEWVTYKDNSIHAAKTGLLHPVHGETHVCAKITESQCRKICELLETGQYRIKEIANMMQTTESIVDAIKHKKAWVEVSNEYDVGFQTERVSRVFSFVELNMICEYFQNNPKDDDEKLTKYIRRGLKEICPDKCKLTHINSIRKLYKKERWRYIYENYNY